MALPTVGYTRIASGVNSSLVSAWMPALQTLLFAAGWTIEYADADAIGSGSAAVPAWDKTPGALSDAGIAIYRMPANGFTRQWYVRLRPGWDTSTNYIVLFIQIGTGQTAGALADAGTEVSIDAGTSSMTSQEVLINACEDGFFVGLGSSNPWIWWGSVERARDFDGSVAEDLNVIVFGSSGTGRGVGYGYRATDGFEGPQGVMRLFGINNDGTNWAQSSDTRHTTTDSAGENSVPLGPFPFTNRLYSIPRLFAFVHSTDAVGGSDHPVFVDGSVKQYYTWGTGNIVGLIARE